MSITSNNFAANSIKEWKEQLYSELQEKSSMLSYWNEVEELSFSLTDLEGPQLNFQYQPKENWKCLLQIEAKDEKKSNKRILKGLMHGANALMIDNVTSNTDWYSLLKDVQLAFIDCLIIFNNLESIDHYQRTAPKDALAHCKILHAFGENQIFFSSFSLQQIGANCFTQLAATLSGVHRKLELNAKDTTLFIELGVGANFLVEVAKFMAIRHLLNQLASIHHVNITVQLILKTGFCNKSLVDPHTNLLRQATEGLSAVLGACDYLCIQPFDNLSEDGASEFGQRMALNVANLIVEELKLSSINASLKGAYLIEKICLELTKISWSRLCEMDENQDLIDKYLKEQILKSRNLRIERFLAKADILVGINAFEEKDASDQKKWGQLPQSLELPYLIFEKQII